MVHPVIAFVSEGLQNAHQLICVNVGKSAYFPSKLARDSKLNRNQQEKLICSHVRIPNVLCSVTEMNVLFRATVHRAFIKMKFDVYISALLTTLEQLDQHCDFFLR